MENATILANNHVQGQEQEQEQDDDEEEFTCAICTETTSQHRNKKFRNGDICAHPYCTDCVIKYIGVKLEDDNTGHIKCPAPDCDHTLDPLACASIVGHLLFLRWCDVLCEAAIKDWERCYCPYGDCNAIVLNECGWKLSISKCPQCKRWFCFRCKTVWHTMISCEENKEAEPLRALAAWKLWQSCPSCGQYVELGEGCPFVTCRCGVLFCYSCGKRVCGHSCTCRNPPVTTIDLLVFVLLLSLLVLIPLGFVIMGGKGAVDHP